MFEQTCLISASLFVLSNLLGFSFFDRYHGEGHYKWSDLHLLHPDVIQEEFSMRRDDYTRQVFAAIFNAIAWVVFCMPLLQVAWVQSRQGTYMLGNNVAIAVLALSGSMTELIARLLYIGTTATTNMASTRFNLDYWIHEPELSSSSHHNHDGTAPADVGTVHQDGDLIGWRVLELIQVVNHGLLLWIDTAEWLFLSSILLLMYYNACKSEIVHFDRNWMRLGLLLAFFGFVIFVSGVFRLRVLSSFNTLRAIVTVLCRFVLLPIWVLWLGVQLPKIKLEARASALPTQEVETYEHTRKMPPRDTEADSFT